MRHYLKTPGTALLISIILHVALFLTLRGVAIYGRIYKLSDKVKVVLIGTPDISPPNIPVKAIEMIERTHKVTKRIPNPPSGISPGQIRPDRLPARPDLAKADVEDVPKANVPAINVEDVLPRPSLPGLSSTTASPEKGPSAGIGPAGRSAGTKGEGSGRVETDPGRIIPREVGTKDISIAEKLSTYKEIELPFIKALQEIAQHIAGIKGGKVDVVFLLDISESMEDDISAVRNHLYRMIDVFKRTNLDFTLGLVMFHHSLLYEWLGTDISILPQTTDVEKIKSALRSVKVSGGERPLDAIMRAVSEVKFRSDARRHFILVTDEYVKGTYTVSEVLEAVKRAKITVDVIGKDEPFQRAIAEQTGGIWMPIEVIE